VGVTLEICKCTHKWINYSKGVDFSIHFLKNRNEDKGTQHTSSFSSFARYSQITMTRPFYADIRLCAEKNGSGGALWEGAPGILYTQGTEQQRPTSTDPGKFELSNRQI
jgi:hypothetical protein